MARPDYQNNHQYCRERDRKILDALASYKILNTNQIAFLYFPSIRMAQKRMGILAKKGKVKRGREYVDQPNFYYVGKRPPVDDVCYWIDLNWVRIWMQKNLSWGDRLTEWAYDGPGAAVATIYNDLNRNSRKVIIDFAMGEVDANKYKSYDDGVGVDISLVDGALVEKYSASISVLLISDQVDYIRKKIKGAGIRFDVYSLDDVKGGIRID